MSTPAPVDEGIGFWKYILGLGLGLGLSVAYVRYGYEPPAIVKLGENMTSGAIVIAAENDFYNFNQTPEVRQRAMAILLSHQPDLITEFDEQYNHLLFNELLRRKADREARVIKHEYAAYDKAIAQPALRKTFEKKYHTTDVVELKDRMFLSRIRKDDFLSGFLQHQYPELNNQQRMEKVLTVYQHGFRIDQLAEIKKTRK